MTSNILKFFLWKNIIILHNFPPGSRTNKTMSGASCTYTIFSISHTSAKIRCYRVTKINHLDKSLKFVAYHFFPEYFLCQPICDYSIYFKSRLVRPIASWLPAALSVTILTDRYWLMLLL